MKSEASGAAFAIREADPGLMGQIAALDRQCFSAPWPEESLLRQLGEGCLFFAALEGDAVLGYVWAKTVLDEGYIVNLAVSPQRRREGIATALLACLQERARQRSLSFLTLEVRESNAPAIALYRRMGFSQAGTLKNHYHEPREDGVIYTWRNSPGPG